jgi:hypothetical protein
MVGSCYVNGCCVPAASSRIPALAGILDGCFTTRGRSRLRLVRGRSPLPLARLPLNPGRSRLRLVRERSPLPSARLPLNPGRSQLRLAHERSPLPSARLPFNTGTLTAPASFAKGRHCLWLGSQGHNFQMLSYKPFNQFQLFYQYRPDFRFSTCLITGRLLISLLNKRTATRPFSCC